jgi:hypothetical protein
MRLFSVLTPFSSRFRGSSMLENRGGRRASCSDRADDFQERTRYCSRIWGDMELCLFLQVAGKSPW